MTLLAFVLGLAFAWMCFTFVAYCAVIKLKDMRDDGALTWQVKALAYPALVPMFVMYWGLNIVVATVLFLDLPREVAFTGRCQRYIKQGNGWRADQARWWCKYVLNPVERNGEHC